MKMRPDSRFPILRTWLTILPLLAWVVPSLAGQEAAQQTKSPITRAETLRGSITPERAWWDLLHYRLEIAFDPANRTIKGSNRIRFKVLESSSKMQIDLQEPLQITKALWQEKELEIEREGNVYWLTFPKNLIASDETIQEVKIFYEGEPVVSQNPPWSGGISWRKDEHDKDFIATSCQGIGASIWWPCKDHGYDEPDQGVQTIITVPEELVAVSNGRLTQTVDNPATATKTYHWEVKNPINNYCVNVNIGNYVHFEDTYAGEGGTLDLSYWVLEHQLEKAEKHFREAPRTLAAFEHWFGKYPFYEDSYKLVAVPYLGMEHQSSVTYGNGFRNGYRGTDLSGTGVGMLFDFIIVHESGHEWWGNNVSMKDVADMWIHESFTNYSENLFVEFHFSQDEAEQYVVGCRKRVSNDRPIIGTYNANRAGSGDMYYKGGNMLHTLRHVINDDEKWRQILRGLNSTFWHSIVTTEQVESYIADKSGVDCSRFFDQYLRGTQIPVFVYWIDEADPQKVTYKFENVVNGFSMPIEIKLNGVERRITVTEESQSLSLGDEFDSLEVNRNFYVEVRHGKEAPEQ